MTKKPKDIDYEYLEMWNDIDHAVSRRNFAQLMGVCYYYLVSKVETTGKGAQPSPDNLKTIK